MNEKGLSATLKRLASLLGMAAALAVAATPAYQYFLAGSASDTQTETIPGYALIGGANDVDDFYRWLIWRSGGGDLVVLRASGGAEYNDLFKLGGLHSVQTVVVATTEAARDLFVADKIRRAEALFIAGGDQWNYCACGTTPR